MYTPDFLILQRRNKKIFKAIIVETKGSLHANDRSLRQRKVHGNQFLGKTIKSLVINVLSISTCRITCLKYKESGKQQKLLKSFPGG